MVLPGWLDRARVHVALIVSGAGFGGYFVLTKASLSGGVDPFVFSTYRDAIGSLTLFLYASCLERYGEDSGLGLRSSQFGRELFFLEGRWPSP